MKNNLLKFILIPFLISFQFEAVLAQNLSISETVDYINERLSKGNISFLDNYLTYIYNENGTKKEFSMNITDIHSNWDLGGVSVYTDHSGTGMVLACNRTGCVDYKENGVPKRMPGFFMQVKDVRSGNEIKSALRYLYDNAKKGNTSNDPFASYSSERNYVNISSVSYGMAKSKVVEVLNTNLILETMDNNVTIYRTESGNNVYFLYFEDKYLYRVDKGVRSPDATIEIRY